MKNKKERTKNRNPMGTKWEKEKSRIKVVYGNYRNPVGEVRINPFKTRARNSKRAFVLPN